MAFIGAHVMVTSTAAAADRAFLTDIFDLPSVDAGGGFRIFGLPERGPAEIAIHESKDSNGTAAIYFMVDDVKAFVKRMKSKKVVCGPLEDQGWGVLTSVTLPGGSKISVYEPRHPSPGRDKGPKAEPSAAPAEKAPIKKLAAGKPEAASKPKPSRGGSDRSAPLAKAGPKARKTSARK